MSKELAVQELENGGSDRWLWVSRPAPLVFVFAEIIDLSRYGGDAETQWAASVSVVDIESSGTKVTIDALRSCGFEGDEDLALALIAIEESSLRREVKSETWLGLAQCMCDYGAQAPMWDECGGEIERDCPAGCDLGWMPDPKRHEDDYDEIECSRCEGYGQLLADDEESESFLGLKARALAEMAALWGTAARNDRLDGDPVNGLGQTAREYAQGSDGLYAAMRRQPEDSIIRKMYGACGKTLDGKTIPSDI